MSFSTDSKEELCRFPQPECCQRAELAALLLVLGSMQVSLGQACVVAVTENATVARHLFQLAKGLFGIVPEIFVKQNQQLKKRQSYRIQLPEALTVLTELGIWKDGLLAHRADAGLIKKTCCKKAYVRGAFLACGSMSDPEKGYHLEFVVHDEGFAASLGRALQHFGIEPGNVVRKSAQVIYIKESDRIADTLTLMGAYNAVLTLENIRILKEMRNQVNREVNCESHNLDKMVEAAQRQREAIGRLEAAGVLEKLPESLQAVARLRLEHPEYALTELGEMLEPPLGKSGMNHRMRKLLEAAKGLG